MQHIQEGYQGLALLFNLNWDRLLWIGAVGLSLAGGLAAGTLLSNL